MVRWLLLLFGLLLGPLCYSADALYLSDAERALIALLLKSTQQISVQKAEIRISEQKERFALLTAKLKTFRSGEPQSIVVKSYEEFIKMKANPILFQEHRLDEIGDFDLLELIRPVRYQSTSLRVQRKIDEYESQRVRLIQEFVASLGIQLHQLFQIESLDLAELKAQIKERFNEKARELTSSLNESGSFEVQLLGKLLKAYFKALPDSQKIEILFQISQMPLNSKPMDILLTMIQSSGPQMQKLVQIMGRSAHVPPEFQKIFQKLESQVKAVPWWKVRKLLLSKQVQLQTFTYLESKPIGVGTMAQTHRAQYVDEKGIRHNVVLRFLKPEIERYLEMDHQILKKISIEIDEDPELKKYKLPSLSDLVEDLHQSVVEELDISSTVQKQGRGRRIYSREDVVSFNGQKNILRINVPEATMYSPESGVMVQDLVFGKKPSKEFALYKEIYPDLYRAISEKMAEIWVEEAFFKSGFFHADLHQGNLLAAVSDHEIEVNVLDFGMTGQLSPQLRESALLLALSIKLDRVDLMAEHFLKLGKTTENPGLKGPQLSRLIQARIDRLRIEPGLGGSLEAWTAWALDQGLELHYEFLKLNRGLTAIEGLLSDSKSDFTIQKLAQKVAFRNKSYVTQLLLQEPKMKIVDYGRLAFSIFGEKDATLLLKKRQSQQCKMLFE